MGDNVDITRRKILASMGAVGAAGAAAGPGTSALFSDEESSENYTLAAEELDLKVGWQQTYTGPIPKGGGEVGSHPVNAFPDTTGNGLQDSSGVVYGVEADGGLYAIDLLQDGAIRISDSGGTPASNTSPNGLAFDPDDRRLYYSVDTGSGDELWFYHFASDSNIKSGDLNAQAAGASWYDGRYWYIKNETDDLNAITFNPDGTKDTETTEFADLTGNSRRYRFGDIAITPDGFLYGSTLGSSPSTADFFEIDIPSIPSGGGSYDKLYTSNPSDWSGDRGGDPTGLQLGLSRDGTLYGQDAGSGEFFEINVGNRKLTSVTTVDDLAFTDIASRYESLLACERPDPTTPDAFQSANYPDQQHLVELSDVKPGDEGEITFRLHLCDNPSYVWLMASNFTEGGGANPEPERVAEGNDDNDANLAENIIVRIWYDEDCNNEYDSDEQLIFGPEIGGFTDYDGDNPATLANAKEVIIDNNDGMIPLDGRSPFMGYDVGATDSERDPLPAETRLCIGVKWELPIEVGNVIQGDEVGFDLGFRAEQARNNNGATGTGASSGGG